MGKLQCRVMLMHHNTDGDVMMSHVAVQSGLGLRCWECLADCGDVTNHQEEQCDQDVEYCLRWIE